MPCVFAFSAAFGASGFLQLAQKSLYAVGDRPWNVSVERIRIGWDGRSYFAYSEHVVCFDRTGKKMWHVELPRHHRDLGIDARGNVYVLTSQSDASTLFVIGPTGQDTCRVRVLAPTHAGVSCT